MNFTYFGLILNWMREDKFDEFQMRSVNGDLLLKEANFLKVKIVVSLVKEKYLRDRERPKQVDEKGPFRVS